MKILFICEANVGRSQMAEAYYNKLSDASGASSAGIVDLVRKYYGKPAKEIVATMKEDGIDISNQNVKLITKNMVRNAKKIVVLCNIDICPTFVLQHNNLEFHEVKDPYKQEVEQIRAIRESVKAVVLQII